jgi:hypothetical protein
VRGTARSKLARWCGTPVFAKTSGFMDAVRAPTPRNAGVLGALGGMPETG